MNSEGAGKILAAVIVCCPPQSVLPILPVVVLGSKTKGWQLAELAAAMFARACLAASELPVHWVTLLLRRQREPQIV